MMNGSQNDLQPDSYILVKFLVLGRITLSVMFEDGWDNILGHVFCPRVNVIGSSSSCILHVQKGGDGFLSDDDLHPQNIKRNVVVI